MKPGSLPAGGGRVSLQTLCKAAVPSSEGHAVMGCGARLTHLISFYNSPTLWPWTHTLTSLRLFSHLCMLSYFSCVRLCNPMDCSPPGSSDHGILQARTLEWVAISFSRRSSQPGLNTHLLSPALADRSCTPSATWEAILICIEGRMTVSTLGLDEIIYLAQCLEHRAAVFYQTSRMKLSITFFFSSGYLEPAHT